MLKVWGRKNSMNVQKVMWALAELGLPNERIDAGGAFGQTKDPQYLAINPNALVPTLVDGDFTLWESNSIVRYLAARHDDNRRLEPADLQVRARAQMWMDWQLSVLQPSQRDLFWGLIRTAPDKRVAAAIDASRAKNTNAMAMLDAQLARTTYVAGDAFTYGDIPVAINAYRYWALVPDHPPLPHARRWYDTIAARPAFAAHVSAVPLS
ncbi:MAG: glutathione S-transferase family protein [Rhizobiales bacterium]|nr:glutathione S-transferase family protein [Hyphomicrobiales bacterium]OJY45650.1 MAG: glutathione S-transferase [Rhizobiales bacterium 64-17]